MQLNVNYQRVWKTFQYSYFFNANFSFQSYVCDSFHDLFQKATSCEKVAIVSMRGEYYRICFVLLIKIRL